MARSLHLTTPPRLGCSCRRAALSDDYGDCMVCQVEALALEEVADALAATLLGCVPGGARATREGPR
mgnify:FL=1